MFWIIKFHTSLVYSDNSVNWLATGGSESLENITGLEFKVLFLLDLVVVLVSKACYISLPFSVSSDQLRGKTPLEGALIQQYVNFADQELLPAMATWVFPTLGLMQFNKQVCKFVQTR